MADRPGAGGRARPRIHWPAVLTIVRPVLAVPVVVLTLMRTSAASWVAFVTFAIAATTDGLDGLIARRMNLVSAAGQLWDPIADKILVLASMAGLVVVGRFPAWAAAVIVARELAVTALRWVAAKRGRGFPASKAGKAKTGLQLVAVLLTILPDGVVAVWIENGVLWLAVAMTVISGAQYLLASPRLLGAADAR